MILDERLSSAELYEYLKRLSKALQMQDRPELATKVEYLCHFASGSSTEFFGETRNVLREMKEGIRSELSEGEFTALLVMLGRIDSAFDRIGDS
jgi:hypothetical protein